jgi:diadenosine tetraphosphate (Ap4A) HIT family hydrolase
MKATISDSNPFCGRILTEKVVADNKQFRIVEDKDPIVPGHLLLFALKEAKSLADSPFENLCDFLEEKLSTLFPNQRYWLVERGRGLFCSSFGNIIHAHGHLVPEDSCGQILLREEKAQKAESLRHAFEIVKGADEYLLAGQVKGGFEVVYPLNNAPKRLARMIISNNLST